MQNSITSSNSGIRSSINYQSVKIIVPPTDLIENEEEKLMIEHIKFNNNDEFTEIFNTEDGKNKYTHKSYLKKFFIVAVMYNNKVIIRFILLLSPGTDFLSCLTDIQINKFCKETDTDILIVTSENVKSSYGDYITFIEYLIKHNRITVIENMGFDQNIFTDEGIFHHIIEYDRTFIYSLFIKKESVFKFPHIFPNIKSLEMAKLYVEHENPSNGNLKKILKQIERCGNIHENNDILDYIILCIDKK